MTSETHTPLSLADLIDKELMGIDPDSQGVVLDDADWRLITTALRRVVSDVPELEADKFTKKPDDHIWVKCPACPNSITHQHYDYCGLCLKCSKVLIQCDAPIPDIRELVRYGYGTNPANGNKKAIFFDDRGDYCKYSQAAEIIAAKDAEIVRLKSDRMYVVGVNDGYEALEADRNHWKANHDNMVQRNAVLSQRPDLPVDRLPAIREYERMLAAKGAEIDKAKMEINALLVSYVREHFPDSKAFQPLGDLSGVISQLDNAITITREFKNRAEAAETEIEKLKEQNDKFKWQVRDTCTRAEMAEAKLTHLNGVKGVNSQYAFALANLGMGENDDPEIFASRLNDKLERLSQYEAQKPVGFLIGDGSFTASIAQAHIARNHANMPVTALYASPAPSEDLKAENERLRESLKAIDKNAVGSMVPSSVISALVDAALNAKTSV